MFNYLGDSPATMPSAVPGAPPPATTGMVGAPPGGIMAPSGPLAASMFPPQPVDPASLQYKAVTQQDGTVLLVELNPDGSPGPVRQIIPPPKAPGSKKR